MMNLGSMPPLPAPLRSARNPFSAIIVLIKTLPSYQACCTRAATALAVRLGLSLGTTQ
jgi:hypothetical protein